MRTLAFLSLLLVPLVTGCDSGGSDDPSIGGTYAGTQTSDDFTARVTLVIPTTESGSTFTLGSASAIRITSDGSTQTFPLTGSGSYDYPTIRLATASAGEGGTDDQLTGTVNASGSSLTFTDDGESFTLTR